MKKVTTVLGDIPPEDLGVTSMHEHTLMDEAQVGQVMMRQLPALALAKSAYKNGSDVKEEKARRKSGTDSCVLRLFHTQIKSVMQGFPCCFVRKLA